MKKSLLLISFCLLSGIGKSQFIQFAQIPPPPPAPQIIANFEGVHFSSIAFADVNGDTYPDVLITGRSRSEYIAKLYLNDGAGSYAEVKGTPFDGVYLSSVAFADVDRDNDPDVLITGINSSSQPITKLYTNDGSGSFTEVTGTPFLEAYRSSIAFADVNGDTYPDVLITGRHYSSQRIAKLYLNDGTGNFNELAGTPFEGVERSSIAFADVNGDTYPDVLITGQSSSGPLQRIAKLYLNDGAANFTEVTGTPFVGVDESSIAFADVNGDTYPDVLITGQVNFYQGITKLYTNDGSGGFTEVAGTPFEEVFSSSIAFADVDGDNDQDVLITGLNTSDQQAVARLYTNDGSGSYTEVIGTPFEGADDSSIAFANVDGDNDTDVLITGLNRSLQPIAKLYTNDGSGSFTEVTNSPFEGTGGSAAFADVNGDYDQDVIITGINDAGQRTSKLYQNDGTGHFTEVTGTPFDGVFSSSVVFADIDTDNDLDVLITGQNSAGSRIAKLYQNDGTGHFTEVTGTPFDGVFNSSVAFADVDADNDPDVLITGQDNSYRPIAKLYTNDGTGHFTEALGTPFDGVYYSSIAFADIDSDSDPDVLITGLNSSYKPSAKLYTNDGTGHFTEVLGTPFDKASFSSIAFADVDADSDPDVLITGVNQLSQRFAKLYANDGSGSFTELTGLSFEGASHGSIAFADVDSDSDPDVLITGLNQLSQRTAKLYQNDGAGHFTEVTGTPFVETSSGSVAFADIDADNDPDVLITGYSNTASTSYIYRNNSIPTSPPLPGELIAVCHKPESGNPRTIYINPVAATAHLAHGDVLGVCPGSTLVAPKPGKSDLVDAVQLNAYPNPFTESVKITFSLPYADHLSLRIYNSKGKEVALVFEGDVIAGKLYESEFIPEKKPKNGLYFYRLTDSKGQKLQGRLVLEH